MSARFFLTLWILGIALLLVLGECDADPHPELLHRLHTVAARHVRTYHHLGPRVHVQVVCDLSADGGDYACDVYTLRRYGGTYPLLCRPHIFGDYCRRNPHASDF